MTSIEKRINNGDNSIVEYQQHISFDPYLSKGFGVRFGDVHQPRQLS